MPACGCSQPCVLLLSECCCPASAVAEYAAVLSLGAATSECWLGVLKSTPCVRSLTQAGAKCKVQVAVGSSY
ncbi:hypothetical protein PF005_g26340 [Phytophthora fragariae]|uniref:Uncharacterized protein n=1 Tax=Phytophthora fragariae TaxID=53985 RepID=A0A6A3W4K5_9STRA|nr:hypothetical protein PF003_g18628 [Phytophthora fragariae]KAE8921257.1 hypothetical protein PF009_g28456 [Phytophthora fragariae]KAE8967561.1 hypothetical protein PF011_g27509 [Phytophthora fragariae]KAE8968608.1 hypothetical protein PF011_g27115 [Phytophthora fragariae]KAE9066524.1 hypothetical protein PF007_g28420 [Phytophthora fragariae]